MAIVSNCPGCADTPCDGTGHFPGSGRVCRWCQESQSCPSASDETVYRYCPDCAQWRNMLVSKRVGYSAVRVECDGCGRARVIADQKATVR